ncbi:MAG: hypothetical protein AB7K86_25440 [Rhodospirillales bacterium]
MRTAMTVRISPSGPMLSPFFAKCQFVLFLDPDGVAQEWIRNYERQSAILAAWILGEGVRRLVCGFIDPVAAAALLGAGLDVRIGPCDLPVREVLQLFEALPRARDGASAGG